MKCNPLAYWEFRDCFEFVESNGLEAHPLHAEASASMYAVVLDIAHAAACSSDTLLKEWDWLVRQCALTLTALAGLPVDRRRALHGACAQGEVVR